MDSPEVARLMAHDRLNKGSMRMWLNNEAYVLGEKTSMGKDINLDISQA